MCLQANGCCVFSGWRLAGPSTCTLLHRQGWALLLHIVGACAGSSSLPGRLPPGNLRRAIELFVVCRGAEQGCLAGHAEASHHGCQGVLPVRDVSALRPCISLALTNPRSVAAGYEGIVGGDMQALHPGFGSIDKMSDCSM